MSRVRQRPLSLGVWGGLAVLGSMCGCGPRAEITLRQPFAPPAQQHLKLSSDWAWIAPGDARQSCALAFRLPGAADGPRAFVMYLTAPNALGTIAVDPDADDAAHGFLIQEVGALKGRSDFASGALTVTAPRHQPRVRCIALDVQTDDGARIVGTARLEILPKAVEALEREFAGDVAQLADRAPRDEGGTRARSAR